MTWTFGDFFAGIGLVELALKRPEWELVFANDNDPRKLEMYSANFRTDHYLLRDIFDVQPEEVPPMDLAWASFPCIDLSLAGKRSGLNGGHSSAFWGFYSVLLGMNVRPQALVVENVLGLMTHNKGEGLKQVVAALNEAGYGCDLLVVDAVHFVPQSRPRLFVVGVANPPQTTHPRVPSRVRPESALRFVDENSNLAWTCLGDAELPSRSGDLPDLIEVSADHDWWPDTKARKLLTQMSSRHRAVVDEAAREDSLSWFPVYRRIRPQGCRAEARFDGVAGCLRTGTGGSSRQIVVEVGRGRVKARFMTPREYARLQGVPDSFVLDSRTSRSLLGLGDAVCVPAVRWLADHFLARVLDIEARASASAASLA